MKINRNEKWVFTEEKLHLLAPSSPGTELCTLHSDKLGICQGWSSKVESVQIYQRALIWYWDHLKNFIAEIPQGPLGMSIGNIWVTQKRFQGPPARGF